MSRRPRTRCAGLAPVVHGRGLRAAVAVAAGLASCMHMHMQADAKPLQMPAPAGLEGPSSSAGTRYTLPSHVTCTLEPSVDFGGHDIAVRFHGGSAPPALRRCRATHAGPLAS